MCKTFPFEAVIALAESKIKKFFTGNRLSSYEYQMAAPLLHWLVQPVYQKLYWSALPQHIVSATCLNNRSYFMSVYCRSNLKCYNSEGMG